MKIKASFTQQNADMHFILNSQWRVKETLKVIIWQNHLYSANNFHIGDNLCYKKFNFKFLIFRFLIQFHLFLSKVISFIWEFWVTTKMFLSNLRFLFLAVQYKWNISFWNMKHMIVLFWASNSMCLSLNSVPSVLEKRRNQIKIHYIRS